MRVGHAPSAIWTRKGFSIYESRSSRGGFSLSTGRASTLYFYTLTCYTLLISQVANKSMNKTFQVVVKKNDGVWGVQSWKFLATRKDNGSYVFGADATVLYSERYKQWVPSWGSCSDSMEGMEAQYLVIGAAMRKARQLNTKFGR